MTRDVHRYLEPLLRAVDEPSLQILLRRESDGVEYNVEAAPSLADLLKGGFELTVPTHITGREERRPELGRERLDVGPSLLVEVSDREIGSELAENAGAAIGDRSFVGDANDEGAFAKQDLRLHGDFGQFGRLIVHELALVRPLPLTRRAGLRLVTGLDRPLSLSCPCIAFEAVRFVAGPASSSERRR